LPVLVFVAKYFDKRIHLQVI